ncbi:GNAT family N-acetyltransferase [Actinoplanes oblitus]|uniref:GNAT family N-acetyltransferase n=1 Tax=Actinoplanes oblitus TaxID=3040509 RepID=A0ABY8WSW4_9ACTN|nr:GNAT family N-acetyltransferase [Actinoplanes oblitus]WIN00082.1 GNAT family N-acetyltransferase [Actinoplanes oblitus]
MTAPDTTRIRRARRQDGDTVLVAGILTDAFFAGDLAGWLVPDTTQRAQIYPPYFRMLAKHAVKHGHVELLGDDATAVWYDLDANPAPVIADYDRQLALITGPALPRFRQLDRAMHRHHPDPHLHPHAYLAFLAVRPAAQGRGLGAALLAHRHHDLDKHQRHAYLEATGPRNRALYGRHGYALCGITEITPGAPVLYPMWRKPGGLVV